MRCQHKAADLYTNLMRLAHKQLKRLAKKKNWWLISQVHVWQLWDLNPRPFGPAPEAGALDRSAKLSAQWCRIGQICMIYCFVKSNRIDEYLEDFSIYMIAVKSGTSSLISSTPFLDRLDLAYTLELPQQSCCANTIHWACHMLMHQWAHWSARVKYWLNQWCINECQTLQHQWVLVYESYTQQPTKQCESPCISHDMNSNWNAAAQ